MKGKGQKICHECGGVMVPCTTSKTLRYLGKEIEIKGLEGYQNTYCKKADSQYFLYTTLLNILLHGCSLSGGVIPP